MNDVDIGDVASVREIVDVAVSVLQDYGVGGETRIEQLARWVVMCFAGVDVRDERVGRISRQFVTDVGVVEQVGYKIGVEVCEHAPRRALTADQARDLATALLVAAERAEED